MTSGSLILIEQELFPCPRSVASAMDDYMITNTWHIAFVYQKVSGAILTHIKGKLLQERIST